MVDLLWPGDHRAGDHFSTKTIIDAMTAIEHAWLAALVDAGVAPAESAAALTGLVTVEDANLLAAEAEGGGNPVIPIVALLRRRTTGPTASWLHRGLTSQDVLDTALVLCLRDCLDTVLDHARRQLLQLADLAENHKDSVMVARTLTQHAVPTTFGAKVAGWIDGVADAVTELAAMRGDLAVQIGGAAGTSAALLELVGPKRSELDRADAVVEHAARALGLPVVAAWHTSRRRITAPADALVRLADAWSHIAGDVTTLSRPEIAELTEGSGGGTSSTMPHKANPALAVLLRRHGLGAPALAATLHIAAASYSDERPDGAWHAEWAPLRDLARRSVVAAGQATDLLTGLRVDVERMRATASAAVGIRAEQTSMTELTGRAPSADYLGRTDVLATRAVARAREMGSAGSGKRR